ncbi:sugar-transfer associated ATP-grasp domain-containing protein [Tabrizicola sp.]|uniref:sugar-transfer associated ATP-grasp domain-containing protein n=1 Tax=Tabrizicola sp. TaxID=2005166 RepID=UPI00286B10FF|nr:sugar-transfer associated ATP-grasp domain-containing protein [Tabrizicola sp.]
MPTTSMIFDKVLTAKSASKQVDFATMLGVAARARGVSQVKIAVEAIRRRFGRQKLSSQDYFRFGLFRPELTDADRDAFVSDAEISRLNSALRPSESHSVSGIISSKIMTELLLRGVGLPCSQTVAVARATPAPMPFPVLIGAAAIEEFLRTADRLPLFGKPDDSSLGVGAASFVGRNGDELIFGDGTRTSLSKLAVEIARDYPDGYVFQTQLRPHPEVARLIGPVVGTLRVITLRLKQGPQAMFSMLKMPGPGAMVDGALSGANAAALIDLASGAILRAQLGKAPLGQDLVRNHVTGVELPGAVLPDFDKAVALALDVHRLFPHLGVLGADVILSDHGPLINEVNLNPLASLAQSAAGRGLFSEANKAMYREALEVQGASLPVKGVRL